METAPDLKKPEPVKFGTFGGVFTPNVLTILGVILFLRAGWVVGNAGLEQALLMLVIANTITLLTSLSLSAVSTNIRVRGGGAYFLISRSLGLEIGGSVGLPLFLAQSVSVAFYIIGFVESLQFLWPNLPTRVISLSVLVVLSVLAWVGSSLAVKTQYVIMGALFVALVSFFAGWRPVADVTANLGPAYTEGHGFWTVFAIYFPAVTGIMSGVSMSGDLRDPTRSIPRGTIIAVVLTWIVYAAQMVWLSMNAERSELLGNTLVVRSVARVPELIFVGLWAATLSSALASLLAAPRTLQALAHDSILPRWLGKGSGPQDEPKLALLFSVGLAGACLLIGQLDLIAPIISMFFLTAYGTVNLVAGVSRLVANPSYRPTFRVHWLPSLLGAAGCLFVMFVIDALATTLAIVVIIVVYVVLKRRRYKTEWGDERSGVWFSITRLGLLKLAASAQHVRNWRPVILVLVGDPNSRKAMVQFAHRLESNRGLLFLAQVVTGDWRRTQPQQAGLQAAMEDFIHENSLSAVGKTVLSDTFEHGVTTLLQVLGVGALEPNTVLIGWSTDKANRRQFIRAVRRILELQRNLLMFEEAKLHYHLLANVVDVWWRTRETGTFMLTLAHLFREGFGGRYLNHRLRLRHLVATEAERPAAEAAMRAMLSEARVKGEVEVIVSQRAPLEEMGRWSERSEFVFLDLGLDSPEFGVDVLEPFDAVVTALQGNVILVKSWHDMQPEE